MSAEASNEKPWGAHAIAGGMEDNDELKFAANIKECSFQSGNSHHSPSAKFASGMESDYVVRFRMSSD